MTSEFTHFNLVIHLSIVQQLALRLCTTLSRPAVPDVPGFLAKILAYQSEAVPNFQKLLLLLLITAAPVYDIQDNKQGRFMLAGLVTFSFDGFLVRSPNSMESVKLFYALWADLTTVPAREQRTTLRYLGTESWF